MMGSFKYFHTSGDVNNTPFGFQKIEGEGGVENLRPVISRSAVKSPP
jgi:hypothetical protein